MAALIQPLVDAFNSVGSGTSSLVSYLLTVNFYLGDAIFSSLKYIYYSTLSLLLTLFSAVQIILEDLVIFLVELLDIFSSILEIGSNLADSILQAGSNTVYSIHSGVTGLAGSLVRGVLAGYQAVYYCTDNLGAFANLLGSSCLLLINLVPRTIYILFTSISSILRNFNAHSQTIAHQVLDGLLRAPAELYLGVLVGTCSLILLIRFIIRTVQERNLTLDSLANSLLRLICTVYVLLIRSVARGIGFVFTILEVTVSNLRFPMISHAGDSDDEDEDRENLVGEIEDSDDEDRARQVQKRRNYDLLIERRNKQQARRGSEGSVEDLLLREVEREREDKLCVICVDKEKCIMILPCRHLCICEGCQGPLRTHRNICPICRKPVKQLIKAYL
ncbi:uncharacterized protein LOC111697564 [Eurytemora carolleeae]|uniref:uncharacterized protein LOC111697564 n=1 Tax=Eurytemora carolleeae TaxID=1294199 RepID=UPI000C76A204|nr:uncharacterized protein LOC111697564 [Eurytemora carolleeae]|eukprot:XP_023323373.1 uncharacterized protein LOC111697564 [Eurytemora affinis]